MALAPLEILTVVPNRFVAGPGAMTANGAGAKSAKARTIERKMSQRFTACIKVQMFDMKEIWKHKTSMSDD